MDSPTPAPEGRILSGGRGDPPAPGPRDSSPPPPEFTVREEEPAFTVREEDEWDF